MPQDPNKKVLDASALLKQLQVGQQGAVIDTTQVEEDPWGVDIGGIDFDNILKGPEKPKEPVTGYYEGLNKKFAAGVYDLAGAVTEVPQFIEGIVGLPLEWATTAYINRENRRGNIQDVDAEVLKKNIDIIAPKASLEPLSIQPGAMESVGEAIADGKVNQWLTKTADGLNESINRYDKTVEGYIRDKDYGKAFGAATYSIAESLPATLAAAFGGPAGWSMLGVTTGAQTYDEVKDREDMSESMKIVDALGAGFFEAIFEKYGTAQMQAVLKKAYKTMAKDQVEKAVKSSVMPLLQNAYKKFGVWFAPIHEGLSEALTTMGQNLTAKLTGEDPFRTIWDGVIDATIVGFGMGGVFAGGQSAMQMMAKKFQSEMEAGAAPPDDGTPPAGLTDEAIVPEIGALSMPETQEIDLDMQVENQFTPIAEQMEQFRSREDGDLKMYTDQTGKMFYLVEQIDDSSALFVDAESQEGAPAPKMIKGLAVMQKSKDMKYDDWAEGIKLNIRQGLESLKQQDDIAAAIPEPTAENSYKEEYQAVMAKPEVDPEEVNAIRDRVIDDMVNGGTFSEEFLSILEIEKPEGTEVIEGEQAEAVPEVKTFPVTFEDKKLAPTGATQQPNGTFLLDSTYPSIEMAEKVRKALESKFSNLGYKATIESKSTDETNPFADQIHSVRINTKPAPAVSFDKTSTTTTTGQKEEKITKIRQTKGWPMSKADETRVNQEPVSFPMAVYQFFLSGGRVKTSDLVRYLGIQPGTEEFRKWIWAYANDGISLDVLNEYPGFEQFMESMGGPMDAINAFIDAMSVVTGKNSIRSKIDALTTDSEIGVDQIPDQADMPQEDQEAVDTNELRAEILTTLLANPEIAAIFMEHSDADGNIDWDKLQENMNTDPESFTVFPFTLSATEFTELSNLLKDEVKKREIEKLYRSGGFAEIASQGNELFPGAEKYEGGIGGEVAAEQPAPEEVTPEAEKPAEPTPQKIATELDLEYQGQWKDENEVPTHDEYKVPGINANFTVPIGSTKEVVQARMEAKIKEFEQKPAEVIPEESKEPTYDQKKIIVIDHFGGMYQDVANATPEQIYNEIPEVTPEEAAQIHAEIKAEFEAEKEKTTTNPIFAGDILKTETEPETKVTVPETGRPEIVTARDAAKDLIRTYVLRGDSIKSLKEGQQGSYNSYYNASIGSWVDGKKYGTDKIVVFELRGKKMLEVFSLEKLYNEILEEKDPKPDLFAGDLLKPKAEPAWKTAIKLTKAEETAIAKELGATAFANGIESVPIRDPELLQLIQGKVAGGSNHILKAWSEGWMKANLAAPIPETPAVEPKYQGITKDEFVVLDLTKTFKSFGRRQYFDKHGITEEKYQQIKDSLYKKGLLLANGGITDAGRAKVKQIFSDVGLEAIQPIGPYHRPDDYAKPFSLWVQPDKIAEIQKEEQKVDTEPTEGQKEAGNYEKGHISVQGMDISIENPKGSVRSGTSPDGTKWSTVMNNTYGYFRGTIGRDKDHVDVFVGIQLDSPEVYIIDQIDPATGNFDELKIMVGFNSMPFALGAYKLNYPSGWGGAGSFSMMPIEEFKAWLYDGKPKDKPLTYNKPEPTILPTQKETDLEERVRLRLQKPKGGADIVSEPDAEYGEFEFDRDLYADGVELGALYIGRGIKTIDDFSKKMLNTFGPDIKPYIKSIYSGARMFPGLDNKGMSSHEAVEKINLDKIDIVDNLLKTTEDVQPESERIEPDSTGADSGIPDNQTPVQPAGGQDRQGVGGPDTGIRPDNTDTEPGQLIGASGIVVSGDLTTLFGQPGDLELHKPEPKPVPVQRPASDTDTRGGTLVGKQGSDIQPARPGDTTTDVQKLTTAVSKTPIVLGSLESIKQSVPLLFPEQLDDVLKAETRFYTGPHKGRGIMFTNQTGTGKTYSGLGIISRMIDRIQQAENRPAKILLLVPSDQKIIDWIDEGVKFPVTITALKSTKDNGNGGSGTFITTYANFTQNQAIKEVDYDLIVYDESHRLMSDQKGKESGAVMAHRLNANHPDYALDKQKDLTGLWDQEREISKKYNLLHEDLRKRYYNNELTYDQKSAEYQKLLDQQNAEAAPIKEAQKKILPELERKADESIERTKVVFLSASPFNSHKTLEYIDKFVIEMGSSDSMGKSYNEGSGKDQYFVTNFGYRMRTNKLTTPEGDVDVAALERLWFDNLAKKGAISGRALLTDFDYSRDFPIILGDITARFNEIYEHLNDHKIYKDLSKYVRYKFYNNLYSNQLFENLKSGLYAPRLQKHLDLGRKVVVFHRYINANTLEHPFDFSNAYYEYYSSNSKSIVRVNIKDDKKALEELEKFRNTYGDATSLKMDLRNPIIQLTEKFGDKIKLLNGTETKGNRRKAIIAFNDPNSGIDILMVQEMAGREGIDLHDIHGSSQRVLTNLELPVSPITTLQVEGRINRIGLQSNAIFEYPILGLSLERHHFGSKINNRVGTAENLAMGSKARDLRRSFKDGFLNASADDPSVEQGTGGMQTDKANTIERDNPYTTARAYYFTNQKKTSSNKSREGKDYFSTPEPLGFKMVEWTGAVRGSDILEPSAGHGAIARFAPDGSTLTAIEPSSELNSLLTVNAEGKIIRGIFEDFDIHNKFDAIAMNPPFGHAASLAIPHLEKAFSHLRHGGRVVALLPAGSSMEKKLAKLFTPDEKGKYPHPDIIPRAKVKLPAVTFSRAGTSVSTEIHVFDRIDASKLVENGMTKEEATEFVNNIPGILEIDLTYIEDINKLFDSIEDLSLPEKPVLPEKKETSQDAAIRGIHDLMSGGRSGLIPIKTPTQAESGSYADMIVQKHSKTGEDLFTVRLIERVDTDDFKNIKGMAKALGGHWSSYRGNGMKVGFIFKSIDNATRFSNDLNNHYNNTVSEPDAVYEDLFGNSTPIQSRLGFGLPEVKPVPENLPAPKVQPSRNTPQKRTEPSAFKLKEGEFSYVEVLASTVPGLTFNGTVEIKSPQDVAFLFRSLQTASVENVFAVGVKEDGTPVILHHTMGTSYSSQVDVMAITRFIHDNDFKDVYILHNHPSGQLNPSDADYSIFQKVNKIIVEGKGKVKELKYIIVDVDTGYYSVFNPDLKTYQKELSITEEQIAETGIKTKDHEVMRFDTQAFTNPVEWYDKLVNVEGVEETETGRKVFPITSSSKVAQFVSGMRLSTGDKLGALILDRANKIVASYFIPTNWSSDKMFYELTAVAARHNGRSVIFYDNYDRTNEEDLNHKEIEAKVNDVFKRTQPGTDGKIKSVGISVLDYISIPLQPDPTTHDYNIGMYHSMADAGELSEPEVPYTKSKSITELENKIIALQKRAIATAKLRMEKKDEMATRINPQEDLFAGDMLKSKVEQSAMFDIPLDASAENIRKILAEYDYTIARIKDELKAAQNQLKTAIKELGAQRNIFDELPEVNEPLIGIKGAMSLDVPGDKLARAQQMEKEDATVEAIWKETGWERGIDGQMRMELPPIKIIDKVRSVVDQVHPTKVDVTYMVPEPTVLSDIIDSPELFKAYPQLANIKITKTKGNSSAMTAFGAMQINQSDWVPVYKPENVAKWAEVEARAKMITKPYDDRVRELIDIIDKGNVSDADKKSYQTELENLYRVTHPDEYWTLYGQKYPTLGDPTGWHISKYGMNTILHEIQHFIQEIEGFPSGGNKELGYQMRELYKEKALNLKNIHAQKFRSLIAQTEDRSAEIGSMEMDPVLSTYIKELREIEDEISNLRTGDDIEGLDVYKVLAGEVEARNAARRSRFSPDERAEKPPVDTEDVSRQMQIQLKWTDEPGVYDAKKEDDPAFIKTRQDRKLAREKVSKEHIDFIQSIVDELHPKAPGAAKTIVVPTYGDLVDVLRANGETPRLIANVLKAMNEPNIDSWAFYSERADTIYIIAQGTIHDRAHIIDTWLHEQIGHKGIRLLFPDLQERITFLEGIYDILGKKQVESEIHTWYAENTKAQQAEEYLAFMTGKILDGTTLTPKERTVWQKVKDYFKNLFDRLFNGKKVTDYDIARLIHAMLTKIVAPVKVKAETAVEMLYHGSGHDFNSFSTDKVNTGMAAMDSGWGLYFTTEQGIAEFYAEKIASESLYFKKALADLGENASLLSKALFYSKGSVEGVNSWLQDKMNTYSDDPKITAKYKQVLNYLSDNPLPNLRHIYAVNLHNGRMPSEWNYIDKYKTISTDQINQINNTLTQEGYQQVNRMTGKMVYEKLTDMLGNQKMASEFLLRAGIDGIKYPSSSLYDETEGATNYVVFDDSQVTINYHVAFRKGKAEDRMINTKRGYLYELFAQKMATVERLQEIVVGRGGKITDASNIIITENTAASAAKAKMENFDRDIFSGLLGTVSGILDRTKTTFGDKVVEKFDEYLRAKHSPERNEYMEPQTGNPQNADFTTEEANKIVQEYEALLPQGLIDDFWEKKTQATEFTLKKNVESGFMSQETYDMIKRMGYNFYVPLRGWKDSVDDLFDYQESGRSSTAYQGLVKAKGRSSESAFVLAYIQSMANTAIIAGEKNKVKQAAAELVLQNKDMKDLFKFQVVYTVDTLELDDDGKSITYDTIMKPSQELWDNGQVTISTSHTHEIRRPKAMSKQHEVQLFMNGQKVILVFTDPAIARAINNENQWQPELTQWLQKYPGQITRWMSANFTAKNPAFMPINQIRDMGYSVVAHSLKYGTADQFLANIPRARATIIRALNGKADIKNNREDQLFELWRTTGGETGWIHLDEIKNIEKEVVKRLNRVLDNNGVWDKVNQTWLLKEGGILLENLAKRSENLSRYATFLTSLQNGRSVIQSTYDGKEVSVNFNTKGRISGALGSLYAFFNANVQGGVNVIRLAGKNKTKFAMISAGFMALGYLSALLGSLWSDDDENGDSMYDALGDWVKENNLVIPTGGRGFITIPMPFGFRTFYGWGVLAHEFIHGKKTARESILRGFNSVIESLSPVNPTGFADSKGDPSIRPIVPTAMLPWYDISVNEDFAGRRLYKQPFTTELQNKLASSQQNLTYVSPYIKGVTDFAFEAGGGDLSTKLKYYLDKNGEIRQVPSLLDINPSKVEHLFDSYLGGRFQFWNQLSITATEIVKGAAQSAQSGEFSDMLDDVKLNTVPVIRRLYQEPWDKPYWGKYFEYRDQIELYNTVKSQYEKVLSTEKWIRMENQQNMQEKAAIFKEYNDLIKETYLLTGVEGMSSETIESLLAQRETYVIELVNHLSRIDSLNTKQP